MNSSLSRENIYVALAKIIQERIPVVLATVVGKRGSTPQEEGSSAIFDANRLIAGTIGGGRVEHEIQQMAAEKIAIKESGYYEFSLKDNIDKPDSVICGGGMNVLLDGFPEKYSLVFDSIKKDYLKRIPGVLITRVTTGSEKECEIERFWAVDENDLNEIQNLSSEISESVKEMLRNPKSGDFRKFSFSKQSTDSYVFLECIVPQPQLVIAGAGHVGKALSHQGKLLGFDVTVWDDRKDYANHENLPDPDVILTGELDQELDKIKVNKDTFVVIVTRGHKQDTDVLKKFIDSGAGYIGMIGSRKKVTLVKDKSVKEGWATPEKWENIHAPVGLQINSKTVEEIAVSIAAELIQVRHKLNNQNG